MIHLKRVPSIIKIKLNWDIKTKKGKKLSWYRTQLDNQILRWQVFYNRGSQPFLTRIPQNQNEPSSRTPKSKLTSSRIPKTPFVSLLLGLFWYELYFRAPPTNCLRTPWGTRTPGWEPLLYNITNKIGISYKFQNKGLILEFITTKLFFT